MSKALLVAFAVILGMAVLTLLGQVGMHQAQLQILYLQTDLLQQQNNTLAARQELLSRENENLAAQNQQMQQHLTSLRTAYQQERAQNQRLQSITDVAGQLENVNWSIVYGLGLVGFFATAMAVLAMWAITRRVVVPAPSQIFDYPPEEPVEISPWSSPEYRHLAIQKARQMEQWERQSVLAYWIPQRISMPIDQKSITTFQR